MCGFLPDAKSFSTSSVVDYGEISKDKPWWLSTGRCGNPNYNKMQKEASTAMANSDLVKDMDPIVTQIAEIVSKPKPSIENYATLLDNIEDCWVCHECLGLNDLPKGLQDEHLKERANELETASRVFSLEYFENDKEFGMMHFGYYFKVLLDRMQNVISGGSQTISIQVTSDSILTPQLALLGAPKSMYRLRPLWGSTIVYELYQNVHSKEWVVRVLFNGQSIPLCGGIQYCAWEEFQKKLSNVIPSEHICPNVVHLPR